MDITSYTPAPPEFLIDFIQDDGTPVLKRGRSTAGAALLAANRAKHFEQLARGGTSTELEDEDEVQPEEYLRRAVGELGHLEHLFALLDGRVAANASKSPQYRDLLAQAATKFHVLPLADDEDSDSDAPAAAPALMPARRRVGWANAAEYLRTGECGFIKHERRGAHFYDFHFYDRIRRNESIGWRRRSRSIVAGKHCARRKAVPY